MKVLMGWYCLFAVEGMALNKPVISNVREDLLKYQPEVPILNSNPENIYDNLKKLVTNPQLRRELGEKGRQYVAEVHDSLKLAKKLIDLCQIRG